VGISSLKHHGTIYIKENIMKQCCTCKDMVSLDSFYKSSNNKDGLQRQCKKCKKASEKPDLIAARSKKYRSNNLERSKNASKTWRANNPKYSIEYYYDNKEKWLERTAKYIATKYKTDPLFRIQRVLSTQVWSYLSGKNKSQRTMQLIGYTAEELMVRLGERQSGFDLDHKIPLTWFKHHTPLHIIWHLDNLQWVETKQNQSKGNRYMHPVSESYLQTALPYVLKSRLPYFNA
jgi:hypothetical protein